ncbi:MAG: helix-turn-helix domain-containing protein [Bacteroidota bacterium]
MTPQDVSRLASMGEGTFLEFKRKVPRPQRIAKEIIAFANTRGGQVLLGVDDDGSVVGLRDAGEEEFALKRAMTDFCDPPVSIDIDRVEIAHRRDVVVVRVPESRNKPHYLVHDEEDDRRVAYIRIDDKSVEASQEAIALMAVPNTEPVSFEFGENEYLLMRYLDQYGRITVSEFSALANISETIASETLIVLTRASVLDLHAGHRSDYFTLSLERSS